MKTAFPALAVLCFAGALVNAADTPASTVSSVFDKQLSSVEREIVSLAEAMPAKKYTFAPTQGEYGNGDAEETTPDALSLLL